MTYSVAIAAHNAAETIAETLKSVLSQTVPPNEIIVVDDGSDDATAQIAREVSPDVTVLTQPNAGCGSACTRAIRATACGIVATVDADDLWLPSKMQQQLDLLQASDVRTLVFAKHRQFHHGAADMTSGAVRPGLTRSDLVFRRKVFEEVGPIFDPPGGRGDMVDWLARAREIGCPFKIIDDVLVMRRIIPGSLSYGRDATKDAGYLAVAHRAIQRRQERIKGSQDQ